MSDFKGPLEGSFIYFLSSFVLKKKRICLFTPILAIKLMSITELVSTIRLKDSITFTLNS